jgi:Tol biopolymer transport system component/tRNA A-37 threonylcarbamoyl transferase component Bud32
LDQLDALRLALADRYGIERELGQGGMATVYLAEDVKHHRKVALKVLRPEIAATVGAGRFAREIEVAARLQHPNILPLLDSGEVEGFFFYVMPYVEGESLRDRLARGGELPIQDAVRILMEVADALSEAHAHGVVHRDIKPDNVLLSGRHALVADFGVAKAVTEATGQRLLTSTGVALGTPTYMAPEQATADPHQDHRVDIYALGVLGYELLTGRAPFSATTAQEMLAAHVTAVPEPVEKYRATVSPALAEIIMKCLAKKAADRWQTAEEVLQHLEPLATPSGGTTPTQTAPVEAVRARRRSLAIAAGGGAITLAAAAVLAWQLIRPKPLTITVSGITQVTNDPGVEYQPAISPDGNEVAYAAGSPWRGVRLFVRSTANIEGSAAVRLGDTTVAGERYPSWSADGQVVRFWAYRAQARSEGGWWETSKLSGTLRSVLLPVRSARLTWSPDGARAAFVVADTIFDLATADGRTHRLAIHEGADMHSLAWSPDGKLLAYVSGNPNWRVLANVAPSSIWIVRANGGTPRPVTSEEHLNASPAWLDAGHLLFVSNRDGPRGVYVVAVGPKGPRGEPRFVPGVSEPHSISYSVAARRLAYSRLTLRQNIRSYPLDGAAPVSIGIGHPVTTGNQVIESSDVSPDGKWLVYDGNRRQNMDLYKMPLTGGAPVPLTDSPEDEERPQWSPDGREILFYRYLGSRRADVMVMSADGGMPAALTNGPGINMLPCWSPDMLRIFFVSNRTGLQGIGWVQSRDSVRGPWREARQLTAFRCGTYPDWSPDGKALSCAGSGGLVLFSPQDGRVLRSDLGAASGLSMVAALFSRDGKTIYATADHHDGRSGIWAIPVAGGPARLVVAFDDPNIGGTWHFSVGPDRLYLTVAEYESDIWVAKLRY